MSLCAVFEIDREVLTIVHVHKNRNESVAVKTLSVSPLALITIATIIGIFAGAILMYFVMK